VSDLVRCSCGWSVPEGSVVGVPMLVVLAPHVTDMLQHWRDGHQVQCRSELRHPIRSLLKRYRQLQREKHHSGDDAENLREEFRRRGLRFEAYDPFTDEWN
jgi:hypothetical protein